MNIPSVQYGEVPGETYEYSDCHLIRKLEDQLNPHIHMLPRIILISIITFCIT